MSVKRNILIGVGGIMAAATIFGGSILPSLISNDTDKASSNTDTAVLSGEAGTAGWKIGEKEMIAEYDNARKKLLDSLVFYVGNATIQETYQAKSSHTGNDPAVQGSGTMVSEDIIAYDPVIEKSYLVARRLSLLGKVIKDVVDARGAHVGTAMANVGGLLTEYYGTGVMQKRDVAEIIEKQQGEYFLSFKRNPERMDNKEGIFYTNPPVKKTYWVQIIGTDDVSMVATGVFTPETLVSAEVELVPGISSLEEEKNYNSNETYVYEGTDGLWIPKGSLYYKYKKTTYAEIEGFLKELKQEAYGDALLEDIVSPLSDPWKQTVEIADGLQDMGIASADMSAFMENFVPESSTESASRREAEAMLNGNDFSTEYTTLQDALRQLESEDGSVRKLEGFSMDSGGTSEKKNAAEAASKVIPLLKKYLAKYKPKIEKLNENLRELASNLTRESKNPEEMKRVLEEIRTQTNEIKKHGEFIATLYSSLDSVLLNFKNSNNGNKNEYSALAELFKQWEESLNVYLSGNAAVVDMVKGVGLPADYPVQVMPLPKDAIILIAEKMSEDEGDGFNLTLKTNMTALDITNYYRNALQGIDISVFNMVGVTTLSGEKGDYEFSIMTMDNNLGGSEKTMIQIVLLKSE